MPINVTPSLRDLLRAITLRRTALLLPHQRDPFIQHIESAFEAETGLSFSNEKIEEGCHEFLLGELCFILANSVTSTPRSAQERFDMICYQLIERVGYGAMRVTRADVAALMSALELVEFKRPG